jgi:hypothetical protein
MLFILQILFYYYCAYTASNLLEWLLYVICMSVSAYYFHMYLFERLKHMRAAILLYSFIILFFICFCRMLGG